MKVTKFDGIVCCSMLSVSKYRLILSRSNRIMFRSHRRVLHAKTIVCHLDLQGVSGLLPTFWADCKRKQNVWMVNDEVLTRIRNLASRSIVQSL